MKVIFNGLIIDEKRAGIGHYGYNIINELMHYDDRKVEYTFLLQEHVKLKYDKVNHRKNYQSSYHRILDEQLFLYGDYKKGDLIHFIDYSSPVIKIEKPFITTIHDLSYYKYPETFSFGSRKIKEILTPLSIHRANKIVAVSESTKRDIIEMFPKAKDKVKVIYPGAKGFHRVTDKVTLNKVFKKYKIPERYILAVGTLEPRKNQQRLLEAFEILKAKEKNIHLVLVGKNGWLYDDIYNKLSQSKYKEDIIFTGYVEQNDLSAIYSGAEAFVYPSIYEGFGLPALEAMCCGTPVVVSNISSLPEVVGDCGIYVDPHDTESIAFGMYKAITDKHLTCELINKGLEQCKKFTWANAATQIIDLYKEILE